MVKINDIFTVKIEDTNIFANGVCHIDGMVVFVEKALMGEECEIEITDVRQKFAYAKKTKINIPSKNRVEPACPAFNECGGCSFLHCNIDAENQVKENYAHSIFQKNGVDIEIEKISAPVSEKYRNKVVFFVENGKYGYVASGTKELVEHTKCLLNDDIFDDIAKYTVEFYKNSSLRAIYLRKSFVNGEIMVCPIFRCETDVIKYATNLLSQFDNIKTVLYSVCNDKDFALENVKFKTIYGDGYITDELHGSKFRISPSSFYQVNHECAETLYEKAIELANLTPNDTCADLFCGTGTIGIICAKKTGATVYGVEINEDAVKDAKYNAKLNGIANISFEATDAKNLKKAVDVAIIDPPRKGCSPLMLETLLRLKPKRIVYVSCNAETLARDLKTLLNDYSIASPLYLFNMFPRTSHVESVVCLTRK